jgi:hypothetical protein
MCYERAKEALTMFVRFRFIPLAALAACAALASVPTILRADPPASRVTATTTTRTTPVAVSNATLTEQAQMQAQIDALTKQLADVKAQLTVVTKQVVDASALAQSVNKLPPGECGGLTNVHDLLHIPAYDSTDWLVRTMHPCH